MNEQHNSAVSLEKNGSALPEKAENAAAPAPAAEAPPAAEASPAAEAAPAAEASPAAEVTHTENAAVEECAKSFYPSGRLFTESYNRADNGSAPEKAAPQASQGVPEKPAQGEAAGANGAKGAAEKPAKRLSDREVIEHTAGLWQYREIADDGTEQHSESHTKLTETPFAQVIGARVRGKMHKRDGTNCDDFFETAVTDDCVIAVVCDGAGSKPLSRIGSRVSSESACAFLKERLTELFVQSPELKPGLSSKMDGAEFMDGCMKLARLVQESAVKALEAQKEKLSELAADEKYRNALGRQPELRDLSATFLAAVIVPLETERGREAFVTSVQIGDGCVCALDSKADAEHCLKLLGTPDSGAFLGETDFLSDKNTRPEAIAAKTRVSRGCSDTFFLMTDGVADDYFPAQPMMKRLYLDLCLNGILPMAGELTAGEDPAPVFYSSVSMSRRSVALQYAKQLLSDSSEESMNGLWNKRDMLRCHSLEAFRMNIGDTPAERLCVWLDNYTERGSFDDRTLCAVRLI